MKSVTWQDVLGSPPAFRIVWDVEPGIEARSVHAAAVAIGFVSRGFQSS